MHAITKVFLGILLFILTLIVVAVMLGVIQVITALFVFGSYVDAHSSRQEAEAKAAVRKKRRERREFSPLAVPPSLPDGVETAPELPDEVHLGVPNVLHWVETPPDELPEEAAWYLSPTYMSNPEGLGYDRRIEQEMWDAIEEYKNADWDRRQEMHDLALKRANEEEIARMEKQREQAGKA